MHVKANMHTQLSDSWIMNVFIPFDAQLVFFFMMISAFSMCCGYYERLKNNSISLNVFYEKRYLRIWPFFAILTFIDLMLTHTEDALYEAFANLTLCFNLLPSPDIKCIGVGWFLGTIFLFYMLFPFFIFLIDNKTRGWKVFGISIVFSLIANIYFYQEPFVTNLFRNGSANIINCAPYFIVGGLIYLYREGLGKIINQYKFMAHIVCIIAIGVFFFLYQYESTITRFFCMILIFSILCIYALMQNNVILDNKFVSYISGISMEIYLCHMVMFRIIEKLYLNHFSITPLIDFIIASTLTLILSIVFSHTMKYKFLNPLLKVKR